MTRNEKELYDLAISTATNALTRAARGGSTDYVNSQAGITEACARIINALKEKA